MVLFIVQTQRSPIMRKACLLLLMFSITSPVLGQYYGERVLEQSFESTDFFFRPSFYNSYGMDGFGTVTPGLIDEPFLNSQINPALIMLQSVVDQTVSILFRNTQDLHERGWYPQPWDGRVYANPEICCFPYYYTRTRKRTEPVLSGAALFRPLGRKHPGVILGATYEMILQDEAYYDIPYDVYRSSLEYDFAGNRTAESGSIPIVDRYQGEDEMHVEGHFISILSGISLGKWLNAGIRIGRVLFDRDGSYGDQNLWRDGQYEGSSSYWQYIKGRSQAYDHWDVSAGLLFSISPGWTAGLTAGYLKGDVLQQLSRTDSSIHRSGVINQTTDWSYFDRLGRDAQSWDHNGSTLYGGLNLRHTTRSGNILNLYYRGFREDTNLLNRSTVMDTSSSDYRSVWDANIYTSRSNSYLIDRRSGDGKREGRIHHLAAAYEWKIDDRIRLHIGAHLRTLTKRTTTTETVYGDRFSEHTWSNSSGDGGYSYGVEEEKNLLWDFDVQKTSLQIPVIMRMRIARPIELLFGLNRSMDNWTITDVTTAIFDFRSTTQNGQTTKEENFGERYTQPKEKRSEVTTSFIGGITMTPSDRFNIRLMVVPNYARTYDGTRLQDLQWWIDLNLFP